MPASEILEWAIWANLDRHHSWELILLKGHLFTEIALAEALNPHGSQEKSKIQDWSFHRKVQELKRLPSDNSILHEALACAAELNAMRNRLAHEPFVDELEQEFSSWANCVIVRLPSTRFQKYTIRTKSTQAIAALAKAIHKHGISEA